MPAATAAASNPFFSPSPLPFALPPFDRIAESHYLPAFAEGMRQHLLEVRAIAAAAAPPTFANTIEALERSGALLTRVSKVFFNLTESNTGQGLQQLQAEVAPRLAAHQDAIWLDAALFARVEVVFAQRQQLADAEQRRLVERWQLAFVRNGARLEPAQQARLRAINERTSTLVTQFQERLLADTRELAVLVADRGQLAGLDASAVSAAAAAATAAGHDGQYLLALQLPSSQAVLSTLQDRGLRQRVFTASLARCSRGNGNDTGELVRQLAQLRAERAALLGQPNHAAWVLADQVAGTPAAVERLLLPMAATIVAKARGEAAELQAWLDQHQPGTQLQPWDWAFVAEQVRKARFDFDENEVKQYFELERVLQQGVFHMAGQLYGLRFAERHDLPVYADSVRVFEVQDAGGPLGLFLADYYARDGKRGGAWMDNFVDQSELLGQRPVVVNVMNLGRPAAGQPTLLGFDEVTTLFHEFGHALHGLLSRVRYPLLSGTAVPRDFVEFPSQLHEDFAFEPQLLQRCARHWRTGEPLPAALIERLRAARSFGQGFASLEYIAAALLDLAWHTLPAGTAVDDVEAFEASALQRAGVAVELVPPRYRSSYFAHVWSGGYSAGYYAYLWSEALAADAYAAVVERGGMTAANGAQLRDLVLSRGMTREPMAMFEAFRGRPLDGNAVLRRRGLL